MTRTPWTFLKSFITEFFRQDRFLTDPQYSQPLYTDTRYDDKIYHNVRFTGTKPSLKRLQQIKNYPRTVYLMFP